tara:strand:+ start:1525 stop:1713 length:189 start_codon:yes stop_codon:yes gene_type:complete
MTINKPLTAKLVSIKLTLEEYRALATNGQVTSNIDEVDEYLKDKGLVFELPQGPAFFNGQWI